MPIAMPPMKRAQMPRRSRRATRQSALRAAPVAALVMLLPAAALATEMLPTPAVVSPGEMHTGAFLLKTSKGFVEAIRVKTDVDVTVSGPTARARVTQAFRNTTDRWVEGTYVYPLPEGAAVDTLKMVVGDRVIVADVAERAKARMLYETARAEGRKAALTEQERPNIFTNSVANVGPGETVVVQVEYQEPVHQADGIFSLRVPLVVAPRYNPAPIVQQVDFAADGHGWSASDPVPDRARVESPVIDPKAGVNGEPVTLAVHLRAGFPLADVASATHAVKVSEPAPDDREIAFKEGNEQPNRDFELTWTPAASKVPSVGVFRERVDGDDYLLAYVTPPTAPEPAQAKPREVVFVIDNSGSMEGPSIAQARSSLLFALGRLHPDDRFNIIRFDNTMDRLYPDTVPADAAHLAEAAAFVSAIEARGGTEMVPPMEAALQDQRPDDAGHLRQIVFLTDGEIGNEQQIFDTIAKARGRSRLFMVGIGSAPNGFLMTRAAELGRGSYTAISTGAQVQERMQALEQKLEGTVVSNLAAEVLGPAADLTPAILPDLYRGEPLVLAARLGPHDASTPGMLSITGTIGGTPWRVSLPIDKAGAGAGLSKVWARRKIDDAEVARTMGQLSQAQADAAITTLALRHHLVTRLTSLVALDKTPSRTAGTPLTQAEVPLLLPAGWNFDSVFGRDAAQPSLRKASAEDAFDARRFDRASGTSANQTTIAAAASHLPDQGVVLPKTATDAELRLMLDAAFLAVALAWFGLDRRRASR